MTSPPSTSDLTLALILYVILPLWGIAGFADYLCHRATKVESTTGIKETLLHLGMGAQVAIPVWMGLFFVIDVTVMLVAFLVFITHEFMAHADVNLALPRRHVSIWEQHAHSYLSTIPFYLLSLLVVLNWEVFLRMISGDWAGHLALQLRPEPAGGARYVVIYLSLMTVLAYGPYLEELWRCWRVMKAQRADA